MSDPRLSFLYGDALPDGAELDDLDLDDAEVRAELLGHDLPADVPVARQLIAETIAGQIHHDEPPEVWAAAERLLHSGLDRMAVFEQLATAFAPALVDAVAHHRSFDVATYRRGLAALPVPTPAQISDAIVDEIDAQQGISDDDLIHSVSSVLGIDLDDGFAATLVEGALDVLSGRRGSVTRLPGRRLVHLPTLLDGLTLTHRLNQRETSGNLIDASVDLAAFTRRRLRTAGGDEVAVTVAASGRAVWSGPDGWLAEAEPGGLVAVSVDQRGAVTIRPQPEPPDPDRELVGLVRAAYDEAAELDPGPVAGADLVFAVAVDHPEVFRRPNAPLGELVAAAGLDARCHLVADNEERWAVHRRTTRQAIAFDVGCHPDEVKRAVALFDLAEDAGPLGDSGRPGDDALRGTLRHLTDPDVMETVYELLGAEDGSWFGPDVEGLDAEGLDGLGLPALITRLREVASRPREQAAVHLLAAVVAELEGDVIEAERLIGLAYDADAGNPMIVERRAWYASDRGDAATATRLWRQLVADGLSPPGGSHQADRALAEQHQAGGGGSRPGRNQPCWCGSGRKYKQCHLGAAAERSPLPERVGWLWQKAVSYVNRSPRYQTGVVAEIVSARTVDRTSRSSVDEAFADPLVFDLALTEGGWLRTFLDERGRLLPTDEEQLAASWLTVERTVYEVVDTGPGSGPVLRDLRTGDQLDVRHLRAEPHQLLCGRAVPDGVSHQLVGGVFPVTPGREPQLLALLDDGDPVAIAQWVSDHHDDEHHQVSLTVGS